MVDCRKVFQPRPNANSRTQLNRKTNMDIGSAFATKYLKASDLQGRDVTVKMGRVEQEKVGDDHKLILYFQGKEKGMVLNRTNANSIADVYGGETEDWYGHSIIL